MRTSASRGFAAVAIVLGVSVFVAGPWAQRYVPAADPALPRLKYPDSLVSANDRCMVTKKKLNPKVRPVYVNGVPMGFC
jgi:hypothetical protein